MAMPRWRTSPFADDDERRYGAFTRSIALPAGVDADAIKATTEDGFLEVRIPKPRKAEPKAIAVESKG